MSRDPDREIADVYESRDEWAARAQKAEAELARIAEIERTLIAPGGRSEAAEIAASLFRVPVRRRRVREFHKRFGAPESATPTVPGDDRVRLRLRLIAEEFFELLEACADADKSPEADDGPLAWCYASINDHARKLRATLDALPMRVDLPAFADALCDLDYVIEGARLEFGIDGEPIEAAVHAANMAKEPGNLRADGKILKGPNWTPPDIAGELRKQGWRDGSEILCVSCGALAEHACGREGYLCGPCMRKTVP